MYKAFIEPDLKAAHLRIYNTFNPFSGFMSPTYILKSSRKITKEDVVAVLQVRCAGRWCCVCWGGGERGVWVFSGRVLVGDVHKWRMLEAH